MLYLYVNEDHIIKQTNPLKINGVNYSNPTKETLKELGYLPLEENQKPLDKHGYYIVPKYVRKTKKIVNCWKYLEVSDNEFA